MQASCFCGSDQDYSTCCQPLIQGQQEAKTAEQLMRSRFSAYWNKEYQYILDTYTAAERDQLSLNEIADAAADSQWLALNVVNSQQQNGIGSVEFKAWYKLHGQYYMMHERSNFALEHDRWRYRDGTILSDLSQQAGPLKIARNQPCFCGSKIKFKRCCGKY